MTRSWFITGSSRGFGRALAETVLADTADSVAVTARDPRRVADLVERYPGRAVPIPLDVTDAAAVHAAVEAAVDAFGGIDVVVNNAGSAEISAFEDTTPESFRAQVEVNFFSAVEVCRAALPHMRARGAGHIVQISAISGRLGVPGLTADTAAKYAIEGFSESLALEVAPLGLRVTLVEPGGMRTDWGGASMIVPPVSAPYEGTVGELARLVEANLGNEPGDPLLCARAILTAVDAAEPPLRLVLGRDALQSVTERDRAKAALDARWAWLGASTDRPAEARP